MAKNAKPVMSQQHRQTSIGQSTNTRPKNKSKKLTWKPYRGQGRP